MTTKKILIVFSTTVAVIATPYIIRFWGTGISRNVVDWSSFSSYFSGLLVPVLSLLNIIVLIRVNNSIQSVSRRRNSIYKKIEKQMTKDDFAEFRVDIERQDSVEGAFKGLDEKVNDLSEVVNTLADKVGMTDFETVYLAAPNTRLRLLLQIAQLKAIIYQELYIESGKIEYKKLMNRFEKEFVDLHHDSGLAD